MSCHRSVYHAMWSDSLAPLPPHTHTHSHAHPRQRSWALPRSSLPRSLRWRWWNNSSPCDGSFVPYRSPPHAHAVLVQAPLLVSSRGYDCVNSVQLWLSSPRSISTLPSSQGFTILIFFFKKRETSLFTLRWSICQHGGEVITFAGGSWCSLPISAFEEVGRYQLPGCWHGTAVTRPGVTSLIRVQLQAPLISQSRASPWASALSLQR